MTVWRSAATLVSIHGRGRGTGTFQRRVFVETSQALTSLLRQALPTAKATYSNSMPREAKKGNRKDDKFTLVGGTDLDTPSTPVAP